MLIFSSVIALLSLLHPIVISQATEPAAYAQVALEHPKNALASGSHSSCGVACAQIAVKLAGQVHFKPSEINNIWAAQQGELVPACRVEPASAKEVAFTFAMLKENQCHFAIKSGGHARYPGASNADGGVTIDLRRMNTVEIAEDGMSAQVGAGSRWRDVYQILEAQGLTVVGGRVADVGVGGLTLGGGLSFWSNKHGWACDRVLSYEIVLPDSTITRVDQKHHVELYRALRGAGFTNFGIVTSFQMETFVPSRPKGFWWSTAFHSWDQDQVKPWLDAHHTTLVEGTVEDEDAVFIHIYHYDAAHDMHRLIDIHAHASWKDVSTSPKAFEAYENMTSFPSRDVKILPYSNLTTILYQPLPGKRHQFATWTHRPNKAFQAQLLDLFKQTTIAVVAQNVTGFVPSYPMQPIYKNALKYMTLRGGNAVNLAKEYENGPLMCISLAWTWNDREQDEIVLDSLKRFDQDFKALAERHGVYHPYKYVNYAEQWQEEEVWQGYGKENMKWLKKLQRKYDPEGIFTRGGLASGYFKINMKEEISVVKYGSAKDEL